MEYAPDGDLSRYDAVDIADAAGWDGDPEYFLKALISCGPGNSSGFVDDSMHIHDWQDYGGALQEKRKANAERQRRFRERQQEKPLQGEGKEPVTHHVTGTSQRNNGLEERRGEERREEKSRGEENKTVNAIAGEKPSPASSPAEAEEPEPESPQKRIPYEQILKTYNDTLGQSLREAKTVTEARKKAIRARCGESPERQDPKWWKEYFDSVRDSPFLLGKNERNWQADLDWLIRESNMAKVLEGKYSEHVPGSNRPVKDYREMGFVK